jgi:hypothetical protein
VKVTYIKLDKPKQIFYAASDVHFGIKNCDIDSFKKELQEAKERNARIILNGDIFDAIFPRGDKRWNPSLLIDELANQDDAPLVAAEMMADILEPYAELIDIIGMGNHEYAVYKYGQTNMTKLLFMMLNAKLNGKHKVAYGGYTGYLGYRFSDGNHKKILKILYHHGSGGSSPVTKGMIDINRKETNWDYDIFLFGHKHNKFVTANGRMQPVFRKDGTGYIYWTDNKSIQTGSFYRNYSAGEAEGTKIPPYEEVKEHAPKPIGGVFFTVQLEQEWIKAFQTQTVVFKIRAEI